MRLRKSEIQGRVNNNLGIQFIRQDLTSYSGLELVKRYFRMLRLNERVREHLGRYGLRGDYPYYKMVLLVIGMVILGIDRLSNVEYIKDDPLFKRFCELERIPTRFSIVRFLKGVTDEALRGIVELNSTLLTDEITKLGLRSLTIDIDGTVVSSRGTPELSGKGYNPIMRGANSYFPLTAYLAQTGHFLRIQNRSGNVHDSNGSYEFIEELVAGLRFTLGGKVKLQIRHDSAFFSEKSLKMYEDKELEYATKVPFWRYPAFKQIIAGNRRWHRIDSNISYFFKRMKLDRWESERLFLFIRVAIPKREKAKEVQLDLFSPDNIDYRYSALCTNMNLKAKNLFRFMSGRSAQENAIGELKTNFGFDAIPSDSYQANSAYQQLSMLSYNLMNSFQLDALGFGALKKANRKVTRFFKNMKFKMIRFLIIYKAGILSKTDGRLRICMTANRPTEILYEKIIENLSFVA
jgi:hypothetical protein